MKVAIVGIQGLPNNYGGFETLADNLLSNLSPEIDFSVYCSSKDLKTTLQTYNGAQLRYVNISSHGLSGIVYDSVSILKALRSADKVLLLGFGAGLIMPFLSAGSRKRITVNIGGLDWKRNKWSAHARRVIKLCEKLLLTNCGEIISDNEGIREYIEKTYHLPSSLIAYGGDQVRRIPATASTAEAYPFIRNDYAFTVARIQSDNNIEMVLEAFNQFTGYPIVVVGNWNKSEYGIQLKEKFSGIPNMILLEAIYDQDKLNQLRSNCKVYIHGHSAGGTNPALVEAMTLELPVIAFASGYNEFTTKFEALYFKDAGELASILNKVKEADLAPLAKKLKTIADNEYTWKKIANQYKTVLERN